VSYLLVSRIDFKRSTFRNVSTIRIRFFVTLKRVSNQYDRYNLDVIGFRWFHAEGSYCKLEDGGTGKCKKIQDCPARLREVMEGRRNSDSGGRCGFQNFTEIVCCQFNITDKIALRPAEIGMISAAHPSNFYIP